jgi:hypothetical protein
MIRPVMIQNELKNTFLSTIKSAGVRGRIQKVNKKKVMENWEL